MSKVTRIADLGGWTARHKGLVYCSPRCGRGCTYAEYLAARERGLALAKKLGVGWTADVWENMGWHFKAVHAKAGVDVYDHSHGSSKNYWAHTTKCSPQFDAHATTPIRAVRYLHEQLWLVASNHAAIGTAINPTDRAAIRAVISKAVRRG